MSRPADGVTPAGAPVPPRLRGLVAMLERVGARVAIEVPGEPAVATGEAPVRATVILHEPAVLERVAAGDHLGVAEAYLDGRVDVRGDLGEVCRLVDLFPMLPAWWWRAGEWLRERVVGRGRYRRSAIGFHYDQDPAFFLAWFDRWRSYSHGIYRMESDRLDDAQARKLQLAIDALGLAPGMDVFDMGGGWGCFVEYAGLQGIRVHTITIAPAQHRFLAELIRSRGLPCTVELVDFHAYRPRQAFDGAVFMGTLEHLADYGAVARFLGRHLRPGARMWADFCAQRGSVIPGAYLRRHLWPGAATYVDPARLVRTLLRGGFDVHVLEDDTLSYACTVRDWGDRLEAARTAVAARHGERAVRTFLLFLRVAERFLRTGRSQAYHLVAGRGPRPLGQSAAASAASAQATAKASPIRP